MNSTQFVQKVGQVFCAVMMVMTPCLALSATPTGSNYDRIKREINMMSRIISSSFEDNKPCDHCQVSVSSYYLADQGAVFHIHAESGLRGWGKAGRVMSIEGLEALPGMVEEIIADVNIDLDGEDGFYNFSFRSDDNDSTRATRAEVREVEREMREIEHEMRELEMNLLHSEKSNRDNLEQRQKELTIALNETEKRRAMLENKREAVVVKIKKDREVKQQQKLAEKSERLSKIENQVLATVCDYGATLKSMDDKDRVSLVLEGGEESGERIFVYRHADLKNCDSADKDFRKKVVSYQF